MNPFEAQLQQHRADPAVFRQRVERKAKVLRASEMHGFFTALKSAFRLRGAAPRIRAQAA
jgi:hypothetical protein